MSISLYTPETFDVETPAAIFQVAGSHLTSMPPKSSETKARPGTKQFHTGPTPHSPPLFASPLFLLVGLLGSGLLFYFLAWDLVRVELKKEYGLDFRKEFWLDIVDAVKDRLANVSSSGLKDGKPFGGPLGDQPAVLGEWDFNKALAVIKQLVDWLGFSRFYNFGITAGHDIREKIGIALGVAQNGGRPDL